MKHKEIEKLHEETTQHACNKPVVSGWDAHGVATDATCKAALERHGGKLLEFNPARKLAFKIVNDKHIDAERHAGVRRSKRGDIGQLAKNRFPAPTEFMEKREVAQKIHARLKSLERDFRSQGSELKANFIIEFLRRWKAGVDQPELQPAKIGVEVRTTEIASGTLKKQSAASWGCNTWRDDIVPRLF